VDLRHVVVAFRMPPGGIVSGPEGAYLARARSVCARGEALGGRLIAWSAAVLAMAWDPDSMEEALLLATSIREESLSVDRAWACGVAEGELEPLALDGGRTQLAWGEALLAAVSLARIARPGEVLVDSDVRALRAGQLMLIGSRAATDAGRRVRGWKLDIEHPWKRPIEVVEGPDATDRYIIPPPQEGPPPLVAPPSFTSNDDDDSYEEVVTAEVLLMVDAAAEVVPPSRANPRKEVPQAPLSDPNLHGALAERVRRLAEGDESGADAIEALADLRRARARAEHAPAATRCQAALALAMTLAIAGRPEEALLEAVDALARAREANDPKAVSACMALLAKLYATAGRSAEAAALRDSSGA
jgi:hypothetical protein